MIEQNVKNYSQAMFSLCKENSIDVSKVNDELFAINDILERNTEFMQLLCSPTVTKAEKQNMLSEVFSGAVSDLVLDFICVIVENSKIQVFSEICSQFKELYYDDAHLLEVTVTTTFGISERLKARLLAKLEKLTGKNVILIEKTDNDLIGGIIIDYNDTQIDASIRSKLSDLKKSVDSVIA